jgi:glycosyltransferase involved in cell wall biosynthesis
LKAAFVVNARNKAKYVARAVQSAFAQTHPCHILLSDQGSTDGTYEVMERVAAETPIPTHKVPRQPPAEIVLDKEYDEVPLHKVDLLRCPIEGKYGMVAANAHTVWLADQTDAEWIFQCSADDYSLPARVSTCMAAVARNDCAAVATTMFFTEPGQEVGPNTPMSQVPADGYVAAGAGMNALVFGSTIQGWRREFLLKIGSAGNVTGDVFHGFLAAMDRGYYVINNPQHVHVAHSDLENMGFQGKMRAAEKSGDKELMARINELNRFQLFELYYQIAVAANKHYPMAHDSDRAALTQMIINQAVGWYSERANLHANNWTPGVI